jgi:hypothetical protein
MGDGEGRGLDVPDGFVQPRFAVDQGANISAFALRNMANFAQVKGVSPERIPGYRDGVGRITP